MAGRYSSESLLSFLKDVVVAGHMPPTTARSRSNAARALMAYLTDGEKSDLRILDIDALRSRVAEDQGGALRPEVASLYIERLESALAGFLPFAAAPGDFEGGKSSESSQERQVDHRQLDHEERPEDRRALESARLRLDRNRSDIVPIPLARGSTVYVHGLPADLSPAEAQKIARVIAAFADSDEAES
jgi:hypothetical protein